MVEKHLNRTVLYGAKTEYFDIGYNRREFFVSAYPINAITSVKEDSEGLFDGSESTLSSTEYHVGVDSASVILLSDVGYTAKRGLQVVYTGGMAAHAVRTTLAIESSTGTWTVVKYVIGGTSGAVGIVKAASSTAMTIETLQGVWEAGETLTEYDSEGTQGSSDGTATVTSITAQSLCEAYPAITRACEMEVRYMWEHKLDMENSSTQFEGVAQREFSAKYELLPQSQKMLAPYRRLMLV
jgi:hypothetical protein